MAAGDIDDAAAAEVAPDPLGHLPGFVQFLARQAAGFANRAPETIEQRLAGKPTEIVLRQSAAR